LCGQHPFWVPYLFFGMNENFHQNIKSLIFIIHEALDNISIERCLCVTFLCEKEQEEHGENLHCPYINENG
jgi:hypothetical protein